MKWRLTGRGSGDKCGWTCQSKFVEGVFRSCHHWAVVKMANANESGAVLSLPKECWKSASPCSPNKLFVVFAQSTDCARTEEWAKIVCLQVGPLHILCRYRLTSSVRRHVQFLWIFFVARQDGQPCTQKFKVECACVPQPCWLRFCTLCLRILVRSSLAGWPWPRRGLGLVRLHVAVHVCFSSESNTGVFVNVYRQAVERLLLLLASRSSARTGVRKAPVYSSTCQILDQSQFTHEILNVGVNIPRRCPCLG